VSVVCKKKEEKAKSSSDAMPAMFDAIATVIARYQNDPADVLRRVPASERKQAQMRKRYMEWRRRAE